MTTPTGGEVTSGVVPNRDNRTAPDAEQERRFQALEEGRWALGERDDHPVYTKVGPDVAPVRTDVDTGTVTPLDPDAPAPVDPDVVVPAPVEPDAPTPAPTPVEPDVVTPTPPVVEDPLSDPVVDGPTNPDVVA